MHQSGSALLFLIIFFIIIIVVVFLFSGGDYDHKHNHHGQDYGNRNGNNGNFNSNSNTNGCPQVTQYSATLNGGNEDPVVKTNASGASDMVLYTTTTQGQTTNRLTYKVYAFNVRCKITEAGFYDSTGTLVKSLAEPTCVQNVYTFSGEWTSTDSSEPLTPELVTALAAGELSLNISTTKYPDGEISGPVQEN